MKRDISAINYPITREDTTIKNIFNTLGVISDNELKVAVESGKILIDGASADSVNSKIKQGQTLKYKDLEVTVKADNTVKKQVLMNQMLKTRNLAGNFNPSASVMTDNLFFYHSFMNDEE